MITDRQRMDRELDAKVCRQALWISLNSAQRLGWFDLVDTLTELFGIAQERDANPSDGAKAGRS